MKMRESLHRRLSTLGKIRLLEDVISIESIKEITQKYNGDLQMKIDKDLVCFKIVFLKKMD